MADSTAPVPVPAQTCPDQDQMIAALDEGRPVVVIVQGEVSEFDRGSEAYGDWVSYLDDFRAASEDRSLFFTLRPARLGSLFVNGPESLADRSTVFIAPGRNAWFFADQVLEPQPYMVVEALLAGDPVPNGMQEFAPTPIEIEFARCTREIE